MIDIHSHILYGIDDGSRDEGMTLNMLRIAEEEGIQKIIATPHYIYGANKYNKDELYSRYIDVVKLIEKQGIEIELYLGNELLLDEYVVDSLLSDDSYTLANTKYILVELPMTGMPVYTENVLSELISSGYRPIIAHPERYTEIQENPNCLLNLIEIGCITQINSTSLLGLSGYKCQDTAKVLLNNDLVSLISSDSHSDRQRSPRLTESYEMVKKFYGDEQANRLFFYNPQKVLEDEALVIENICNIEIKRNIVSRMKSLLRI